MAALNEQAVDADRLSRLEGVDVNVERKKVFLRWGVVFSSTDRLRTAAQVDCGIQFG